MFDMFAKALQSLSGTLDVMRRGAFADALFFDEASYRDENEDVAECVDAGLAQSFYDHYVLYGRWEGRRFALRRFGLNDQQAMRLFNAAGALEVRLDALLSRLRQGEMSHALRSDGGRPLVKPRGPGKYQVDGGPWRAPLSPRMQRGGYWMLRVTVVPARAPLAFRALRRDGTPLGEAVALFCKPTRAVQRLLRLPPGAELLEIELLDPRVRSQPLRVSLRPVRDTLVERRMLRRLVHHHMDYLGLREPEAIERFRQRGGSLRELMWDAYESTFPAPTAQASYAAWIDKVETPHFAALQTPRDGPLISILLPLFDPPDLRACIESVLTQSYPSWELCVVGDAHALDDYADPRIRVCQTPNDALGELVVFFDQHGSLHPHALKQIAHSAGAHPHAQVFYSDEDRLGDQGVREAPHFKPAFDPDLLLGQNYLGHVLVSRADVIREIDGFRPGHDLALRLTERLSAERIVHIPHVLYHRHTRASETGMAAIEHALARREERAEVVPTDAPSSYRVRRALPEPAPLVSIAVPTRDAVKLLSTCIDSLFAITDYPRFEVIVVDNGSRDPAALAYLERIASDERVRVLRDNRPFNFSALNNLAARHAAGSFLALLNNDIEVIRADWLRELVSHAARPGVGCVGAKLLFPDGTIQHAGVIVGMYGLAGHAYRNMSADHPGYFDRLHVTHAVSAVTAACLVVDKSIYQEVGGFDEALAVTFNDVDFCLKVRQAGYRNLLVPHAVLVHHESATRGLDHLGAKRQRWQREVALVKRRWGTLLYDDPCYSPNLSLDHEDYSIRSVR